MNVNHGKIIKKPYDETTHHRVKTIKNEKQQKESLPIVES